MDEFVSVRKLVLAVDWGTSSLGGALLDAQSKVLLQTALNVRTLSLFDRLGAGGASQRRLDRALLHRPNHNEPAAGGCFAQHPTARSRDVQGSACGTPSAHPGTAVGGITVSNRAAYQSAGAKGFGIGSALYKPGFTPPMVAENAMNFIAGCAVSIRA